MSVYFEKAKELGELILASEASLRLADARAIYESDAEAQELINNYTKYQNDIRQKMEDGSIDNEQFRAMSHILSEMVHEVKSHPVAGGLVFAENEFNSFVNQVMDILRRTITGEQESSCGGSCSSCSGCH